MKRLLILLVLMPVVAWGATSALQQGTVTYLTLPILQSGHSSILGIPRNKVYVCKSDSSHWYAIVCADNNAGSARDTLFYTANNGSSFTKNVFDSEDYHRAMAGLGDSVVVVVPTGWTPGDRVQVGNGTTLRSYVEVTATDTSARAVPVIDSSENRIWVFSRQVDGHSTDENIHYNYTTNGGANWTRGYVVSLGTGTSCRIGAFPYNHTYPMVITYIYGDSIYPYMWSGSAFVKWKGIMATGDGDAHRDESVNGIVNYSDTSKSMIFFVRGWDDSLLCYWKRNDQTNYHLAVVDTAAGDRMNVWQDYVDWKPMASVINGKLAVFYTKHTTSVSDSSYRCYVRVFDPSDSSWSSIQQVGTRKYCLQVNAPQNSFSRSTVILMNAGGQNATASESVFFEILTDTTASEGGVTPPSNLTYCELDTLKNDVIGEGDTIGVTLQTALQAGNDSVIYIIGAAYHDSTYNTGRYSATYISDNIFTFRRPYTGTETYTAYLSAWIWDATNGYSGRCQATYTFHAAVAPVSNKRTKTRR